MKIEKHVDLVLIANICFLGSGELCGISDAGGTTRISDGLGWLAAQLKGKNKR